MSSVAERSVLITGASSGIGQACAQKLSAAGFLVFAGVRRPIDAERLRRESGGRLVPVEIDVTDEPSIKAAAELVRAQRNGRGLDGLVNNAGIGVSAPVEYIRADELRRQFEVNVFGQIAVTQAFLPFLREARGRIVNIGSVGSYIAIPFGGALCGSKSAFTALNDALRLELHPFGIHVSMVDPGMIDTPAVEKTLDAEAIIGGLPPEGAARYGAMLREFIHRTREREKSGSPPDVVANAVAHALTTLRPQAHYPVGKGARLLATMPRFLSDELLDLIRYRLFGIPAKFAAALRPKAV